MSRIISNLNISNGGNYAVRGGYMYYGTTTGTGDAYSITISESETPYNTISIPAYIEGLTLAVRFHTQPTANYVTLRVNNLTPVEIVYGDGSNPRYKIVAGAVYILVYAVVSSVGHFFIVHSYDTPFYSGSNVLAGSSIGTTNATGTSNDSTYLNHVENGEVTSGGSLQIRGSGGVSVSGANGMLKIAGQYKNVFAVSTMGTQNAITTNSSTFLNHVENNNNVRSGGSLQIVGLGDTTVNAENGVLYINSTGGSGTDENLMVGTYNPSNDGRKQIVMHTGQGTIGTGCGTDMLTYMQVQSGDGEVTGYSSLFIGNDITQIAQHTDPSDPSTPYNVTQGCITLSCGCGNGTSSFAGIIRPPLRGLSENRLPKYSGHLLSSGGLLSAGPSTTFSDSLQIGTYYRCLFDDGKVYAPSVGGSGNYEGKIVLASTSVGTTNTSTSSGNVFLNYVENGAVTQGGSLQIVGGGSTSVSALNGTLTITSSGSGGGGGGNAPSYIQADFGVMGAFVGLLEYDGEVQVPIVVEPARPDCYSGEIDGMFSRQGVVRPLLETRGRISAWHNTFDSDIYSIYPNGVIQDGGGYGAGQVHVVDNYMACGSDLVAIPVIFEYGYNVSSNRYESIPYILLPNNIGEFVDLYGGLCQPTSSSWDVDTFPYSDYSYPHAPGLDLNNQYEWQLGTSILDGYDPQTYETPIV